jgi:hypothetical protein
VRPRLGDASGSRRLATVVAAALVLAAAMIAYLPLTDTPAVRPATASARVFSAERAMTQLEAIASTPRPMGSAEHDKAVASILARLDELGVESQVVAGVATRNDFNQVFAGRLTNVIARIPGTHSTGAVAMMSHFDSLPTSMNANDGGLGVAALLETVRAIQAGPPLANDLVLWFGDADETTALNALLFQQHPWFGDVRFGFAFEAPGVTGPSVLTFAGQGVPDAESPLSGLGGEETLSLGSSPIAADNGSWLREALEAVPDVTVALPVNDLAMGASPDLGMSMWGSDLAGVSFSQVGDSSGYHTMLDSPDRVSLASLQDAGNIALALTRHFGDLDLGNVSQSDGVVAFTVAPNTTVTYPAGLALPAALLVLVALIALVVVGKRRRRLTISAVVLGIGLTLVAVVVGAVAAVLVTRLVAPDAHFARNPTGVGWRIMLLASVTMTVVAGLFLGATRVLRRETRVLGLSLGPVVVASILAAVAGASMPALSYAFLWPALAATLLAVWQVLRHQEAGSPWPTTGLLAAVGAAVALVGVPLIYLLASAASVAIPMFAAVLAIFIALLGSLLVPHLRLLTGRRLWVAPAVLATLAATCLGGVQLSSGYDAGQPRPDYVQYTLDADSGTAAWLSAGKGTDAWTEQFFRAGYTTGHRAFSPGYFFDQEFDVIEAPAPAVNLPAPELAVINDTKTNGVRTLQLRLTSPRGAPAAHLDLTLPGDLVAATVGGQTIKVDETTSQRRFPLAAYNIGTQGMEISISVRGSGLITGTFADFTNGLPEIAGMTVTERPAEYMPAPFDFRDPTVVTRTVRL